jgi:hypothetical protein
MPSGRDCKSLYDRQLNALITLYNITSKDAVPTYFPPMTSTADAGKRQNNLLDITNDAMILLRAGHYLSPGCNVLDTAQLMPFKEIRNEKFI